MNRFFFTLLPFLACLLAQCTGPQAFLTDAAPSAPAEKRLSSYRSITEALQQHDFPAARAIAKNEAEAGVVSALEDLAAGKTSAAGRLMAYLTPAGGDASLLASMALEDYFKATWQWENLHRMRAALGADSSQRGYFTQLGQWPKPSIGWQGGRRVPFEPCISPYHTVVNVTVGGKQLRMLVDSGASQTVLSHRGWQKAGLTPSPLPLIGRDTHGVASDAHWLLLPSVVFSGLRAHNVPAVALTTELPATLGIDGVLGWPLLAKGRLTINYNKQNVTFSASSGGGSTEGNLHGWEKPYVRTRLADGTPQNLFFDTGSNAARFYKPAYNRPEKEFPGGFGRSLSYSDVMGANSRKRSLVGGLTDVTLYTAGHAMSVSHFTVHEKAMSSGITVMDGLLGSPPFATGSLVLDFPRRRLDFVR